MAGRAKKILFRMLLALSPLIILIIAGEIYGVAVKEPRALYQYDETLGWQPKSNYQNQWTRKDISGKEYPVTLSTNEHGFRLWGDMASTKEKILVVGDSYTGDPHMSDDESFFGYMKKALDVEVFAFGGEGYGTLQELMIVERYAKVLKPDFLVLQFAPNDYLNNSYEQEGETFVRNQKNLRPYWKGGKIIYRDSGLYKLVYRASSIFRLLDQKLQIMQYVRHGGYSPKLPVPRTAEEKKARERSVDRVTEELMKKMAAAMPSGATLITFHTDTKDPAQTSRWSLIAKRAGFTPLAEVSRAVERAEKEGEVVRARDGAHWNPRGHQVAAQVLIQYLEKESGVSRRAK